MRAGRLGAWPREELLLGAATAQREPGHQGCPRGEGSAARHCAGTAPRCETRGLASVPAKERLVGTPRGAGDSPGRGRPGGGHQGPGPAGQPRGWGPQSDAGFAQAPLPGALVEGGGPAPCTLSSPQHGHPEVFPKAAPESAAGPTQPAAAKRTVRFGGWGRGTPSPAAVLADNKHRFLPSRPWPWSLPAAPARGQ